MKFENSIVIHQPVEKVFEYVTDFNNNSQWQTDILKMDITSEEPFGQGSTYRCVNRFMGKLIETEGLITEFEPDRLCSIRITSGTVTGHSCLHFEGVDGGTRFTAAGELDLAFFRLARLLVRRKVKQQLKNDMDRLKGILENRLGW